MRRINFLLVVIWLLLPAGFLSLGFVDEYLNRVKQETFHKPEVEIVSFSIKAMSAGNSTVDMFLTVYNPNEMRGKIDGLDIVVYYFVPEYKWEDFKPDRIGWIYLGRIGLEAIWQVPPPLPQTTHLTLEDGSWYVQADGYTSVRLAGSLRGQIFETNAYLKERFFSDQRPAVRIRLIGVALISYKESSFDVPFEAQMIFSWKP